MTMFGQPRRHLAQCGSTNDAAREWALSAANPAPSGALVTADFQTRGRGQRGHQWQAGLGQSALMSFVYRLPTQAQITQIGLVTALAVAEALAGLGEFSPKIKWPNDILLEGRKTAGILVEATEKFAVLGIGINVHQTEFAGADDFVFPPTSLRLESGTDCSVATVIEAVGQSLTFCEYDWHKDGFPVILERCRARMALGVQVRQGGILGTLAGLTDQGAAQVRLAEGTFAEWTTVN